MNAIYEEDDTYFELERDLYFDENNQFKNDRNLIIDALKKHRYYLLQYANDEIKNDMEVALLCVGDPFFGDITFLGKTILQDPNFIIEAYKQTNPLCPLSMPIKKPLIESDEKQTEKKSFLDYLNFEMNTQIDLDHAQQQLFIDKYSFIRFECGKNLVDCMWSLLDSYVLKNLRIGLSYDYEIKIPGIHYLTNCFMSDNHYKIMISGIVVFEEILSPNEDCASKIVQKVHDVLADNIESIKKFQNVSAIMQWD